MVKKGGSEGVVSVSLTSRGSPRSGRVVNIRFDSPRKGIGDTTRNTDYSNLKLEYFAGFWAIWSLPQENSLFRVILICGRGNLKYWVVTYLLSPSPQFDIVG